MNRTTFKSHEPYAFLSFAPCDAAAAHAQAEGLREKGIKICCSDDYPDHAARQAAMEQCDCFVLFLTSSYEQDEYCILEALSARAASRRAVVVLWDIIRLPEKLYAFYRYERQVVFSHLQDAQVFGGELARAIVLKFCVDIPVEDAYEGHMDYAFVSYAHLDSLRVFKMLARMQSKGLRLWYDAGIQVGTEWDGYIASHIDDCSCFIFFATAASMASEYCIAEIERVCTEKPECPFVVVFLDDSPVPERLGLLIQDNQNLFRNVHPTDDSLVDKLLEAQILQSCKDRYVVQDMRSVFGDLGLTLIQYVGGCQQPRLPTNIKHIGPDAIIAPNAKHIVVPEGVERIEERAFAGCGMLESIDLPSSLREIRPEAFMKCASLRRITLPANIRIIHAKTFSGCVNLSEVVWEASNTFGPAKITPIIEEKKLSVVFGRAIRENAFENCESLESFDLPDDLASISNRAFQGCRRYNALIPASVSNVGNDDVFKGCASVVADGNNDAYSFVNGMLLDSAGTKVLSGKICDIEYADVPEGVEHIADNAFFASRTAPLYRGLKTIRLPSTLKTIGARAFACCHELESIVIPDGVTEIGEGAFSYCGHAVIVVPSSVRRIARGAFHGCAKVEVDPNNDVYSSLDGHLTDKRKGILLSMNSDHLVIPEGIVIAVDRAFHSGLEGPSDGYSRYEELKIPSSLKGLSSQIISPKGTTLVLPNGEKRVIYNEKQAMDALRSFNPKAQVRSISDEEISRHGIVPL